MMIDGRGIYRTNFSSWVEEGETICEASSKLSQSDGVDSASSWWSQVEHHQTKSGEKGWFCLPFVTTSEATSKLSQVGEVGSASH
jgi:hypothetical protein